MLSLDVARLDWYEATIDGVDDDQLAVSLALITGGKVVRGKARNGYALGQDVVRDGHVLAQVHGRSARLGEGHVTISGQDCDQLVPALRRLHPDHRVSRLDSSIDFSASFSALHAELLEFAEAHGISHRFVSDSDGGATMYLGAPTSEVRLRVYKKTEQLRALNPAEAHAVPDGVVRAEVQVRPGKRSVKEAAALIEAPDVWGMAQWSQRLAVAIFGFEPARTITHFRRETDDERALRWMGRQYAGLYGRLIEEHGVAAAQQLVLDSLAAVVVA